MQQFIGGIIAGLFAAVLLASFFFYNRVRSLQRSRERFLRQFEELGRLTGVLAHEIKNPLSTVKVNLKLISENLEDCIKRSNPASDLQRAQRKIGIVRSETDRLEQILDRFLHYTERRQPQLESADINEIVRDMIDFYFPQAQSHHVTVRHLLCEEPLHCHVDTGMLKQAMLNILINAQQAMESGGELMIRTERHRHFARVQISDTGCGIAPEKLDNVFDAYYSTKPNGSGLGLPTARRIIEAHNGTIAVASDQGQGTSFTIELPLIRRQ